MLPDDQLNGDPVDLSGEYARMRLQLESLLAQPVKDMPQVDALVHQLEQLQLRIKQEHGLEGNNPNE